MKIHEIYIKRCLDLAKNGLPAAIPNPSVGAVVVYKNKIIGEGYTSAYGGNHAEVNAINAVKNKSLLSKATLYVSLEPCSHYGKTPPCCELIIAHKIPNVIVGTIDPNSKVAGNGIKRLLDNGVTVIVGVLEKECRELNNRFFTFHQKKRPYIILKWAETLDGYIAPFEKERKEPVWISNEYSRLLVHKWRSEEQAILVGTNTVMEDNPKLDVRDWSGKNPIRIVLDRTGKISNDYFIKDKKTKTIIVTEQENLTSCENVIYENVIFDIQLAQNICTISHKNNIQSVIVEGGSTTLETFINANIWDEARVFKSNFEFKKGVHAPVINKIPSVKTIKTDQLKQYFNYD